MKKAINFVIGIINGLIGGFEGFVNVFVKGINLIIGGLNKISFDIPDWVPLIGGKKFGFSIPKMKEASFSRIPKLAQGAVIPPNREFLAVLGDQKKGTNIETPESLLREIYAEQNQPMIEILSEMLEELKKGHVIKADKREIAKTVREGEKDLGKSFVTGGFANAY